MRAVILAGGLGTRLRPFTTSFPKPLMPLGEHPVLEILLRRLKVHGVEEVTLLTGHLAYLIESYFADGSGLGMAIDYVREDEPLGTAGPMRQLRGRITEDFLVMNGDLLTDVDFGALMRWHEQTGASATVSMYRREERLELGVLKVDAAGNVTGYDEKPTLSLDISMGLYALSPDVLERIPAGRYDMPQLIVDLLSDGRRVVGWPHSGLWFDIGRADDYASANEAFTRDPGAFLPDLTR